VELAHSSVSSNRTLSGRSTSLRILCDQLEHTQANLVRLQTELEQLMAHDPGVKGLEQIPEFGPKTVAVLRAALGDVHRFSRTDKVIVSIGHGYRNQRKRSMERQNQALQEWEWVGATSVRAFRLYEVFTWRGPLLVPTTVVWCSGVAMFGSALPGNDAENAGGGCPLAQT
jgi:transposase